VRHFPDLNADVFLKILQSNGVCFGDDQQVAWRDGLEIHEGDHRSVFVDNADVRLTSHYGTKDASVVRHGLPPQGPEYLSASHTIRSGTHAPANFIRHRAISQGRPPSRSRRQNRDLTEVFRSALSRVKIVSG
jgi:hypothetical protein